MMLLSSLTWFPAAKRSPHAVLLHVLAHMSHLTWPSPKRTVCQ